MKEFGQFLREQREAKKISLEEVAISTKIGIRTLQAIEEGNVSKLPAKPFVRGFIQSYCRYLGIDTKDALERFHQSVGAVKEPNQILLPENTGIEKNLPGSGRNIFTIAAIVVVIIGIILVQRLISQREAEMHRGEVQAITGNDAPLHIVVSSPSPSASPTASPLISPSPSPSESASPLPTESPAPTSIVEIPSAGSALSVTGLPSPTAGPEPSKTPEQISTPTETPAITTPQEIIVEALDSVTIKVTIDGKSTQEYIMVADQILTFKGKNKIRLYTPNGGAISVIANGFDLGVPGNLGQQKLMVFPK